MSDIQESILRMSFSQTVPKQIVDKISNSLESNKQKDDNVGKQDKQNVVYNQDKSHPHWRLRDGEKFTKVFYNGVKDCPKTKDGKFICMTFLIQGLCDASCNRAHSLSKEDAKVFNGFSQDCHEGASKLEF
jgi:hypothetical protein